MSAHKLGSPAAMRGGPDMEPPDDDEHVDACAFWLDGGCDCDELKREADEERAVARWESLSDGERDAEIRSAARWSR